MPTNSIEKICAPIQQALHSVEENLHQLLTSNVDRVTQVASHIVGSGGKRVRPILCILAGALFTNQLEKIIQMACAFEFIHTATLLHDDVIDHATTRRGLPAANTLWGNKASILVGDYLYCKASTLIAQYGDCRVLKIVAEATGGTTEGEILEITQSSDKNLSEKDYLNIIYHKTAFLMGSAAEVGSYLGGASKADQIRLKNYGVQLGMIFQLVDDSLDYTAADAVFGKKVGTDLKEGKITLPMIVTLSRCTAAERNTIEQILAGQAFLEDDLKVILELFQHYEALEYTREKIEFYSKEAQKNIAPLAASPIKTALEDLLRFVVERTA